MATPVPRTNSSSGPPSILGLFRGRHPIDTAKPHFQPPTHFVEARAAPEQHFRITHTIFIDVPTTVSQQERNTSRHIQEIKFLQNNQEGLIGLKIDGFGVVVCGRLGASDGMCTDNFTACLAIAVRECREGTREICRQLSRLIVLKHGCLVG